MLGTSRGAKLAALERDPQAALDGSRRGWRRCRGGSGRWSAENPFAEISEQLTRLYAQKDAAVETVLGRLAPLEAKLAELERGWRARPAGGARPLRRAAGGGAGAPRRRWRRGEPVRGDLRAADPALRPEGRGGRDGARRGWRRWRRSSPSSSGAGERDPRAALDRFAERLEAVQGRVGGAGGAENPFAEISEQLTRLYAQKDAAVETVLGAAGAAGGEARRAGAGQASATRRRCSTASRSGWRRCRAARRRWKGENPFAEISEQLTRLYAQKDAAVEAVLARLAPLEAKLARARGRAGAARAARRGRPARGARGARGAARGAALGAGRGGGRARGAAAPRSGPSPTGSPALLEAAAEPRWPPLEARLAALEARGPDGRGARAARARRAQARRSAAPRRRAGPRARGEPAGAARVRAPPSPAPTADELEAIWSLPRMVSLHRK